MTPPIADVQSWVRGRVFPADKPLLDVSQAVPSYPPASAMAAHLAALLDEPQTSVYTDILGLPELRGALAVHLSLDYDGSVSADQVGITAGCNQAFCVAIDALAGPGDEVVLPVPYYFNHQMWLEMRGISPRHVRCGEDGLPAVEAVAAALSSKSRAIVLVSPNNPTGTEYPADLIDAFYELARERGIALVIDETYKDFRSIEGPPHRLLGRGDWDQSFVQLFSFSKAYSLTGYRVGALITSPGMLEEAAKILDCTAICAPHIGQRAGLFGLTELAEWRAGKAGLMQARMRTFRDAFLDNRIRYKPVSSGAYFAYVRHPFEIESANAVAHRLADEANILCLPGSMFGPDQERYLRFAFANLEAEQIPELVRRLVETQ